MFSRETSAAVPIARSVEVAVSSSAEKLVEKKCWIPHKIIRNPMALRIVVVLRPIAHDSIS